MVGGEKTLLGGEYVGGEIVPWWRARWWRVSLVASLPGGEVTGLSARVCIVDCIHLKAHKFNQVRKPETLDLNP